MTEKIEYTTNFNLAPGEKDIYGTKVMPSLLVPYLKGELMCSSTRFMYKVPNTLLGIIPMGYNENTMPLRNLASVSVDTRFLPLRAIIGILLAIYSLSHATLIATLVLFIGIAILLTSAPVQLTVTNPAGGKSQIVVSILDKSKLQQFKNELQNRIFADRLVYNMQKV